MFFKKTGTLPSFSKLDSAISSKENWGKLIFENTLSLSQNLLPFKKNFFSNLDSANFENNWEKNFPSKTLCSCSECAALQKKFFSVKLFFQSGLCRFFREKLRKTFLRKHYVLVQNLLLFKKSFFSIKLFFNLDSAGFLKKTFFKGGVFVPNSIKGEPKPSCIISLSPTVTDWTTVDSETCFLLDHFLMYCPV